MSIELWQPFSAEYLLLHFHISNCTCFCFPQTSIFNIGFFLTFQLLLTFQLSTISLMLRQSRAFLEYFHILREEILFGRALLDCDRLLTWLEVRKIPGLNCDWNSFPLIVALRSWTICYNLYSPFSQDNSLKLVVTIAQLGLIPYGSSGCLLYSYTGILKWLKRDSVIIRLGPSQITIGRLKGTKRIRQIRSLPLKVIFHIRKYSYRQEFLLGDQY